MCGDGDYADCSCDDNILYKIHETLKTVGGENMQWGRECVNYFAYCSKKLYYDKGTDISGL